jgi:hypothetical protein
VEEVLAEAEALDVEQEEEASMPTAPRTRFKNKNADPST